MLDVTKMTDEFLMSFRKNANHRLTTWNIKSEHERNNLITLIDRLDIEAVRRGHSSVVND